MDKMAVELPAAARPQIRKAANDAWQLGQDYRLRIRPHRRIIPKDAIRFFTDRMHISAGEVFENKEDEFREAIRQGLLTGDRRKAIKDLEKNVRDKLTSIEHREKLDWIFRQETNRARNFSRLERFEQIGVKDIEVVSVLDQRTSEICKLMNGRRFSVKKAVEFTRQWTSTSPGEVYKKFKQPPVGVVREWDGQSTNDIIKQAGVKVPPYHAGGCRTTVVASERSRLRKKSGSLFTGELQKPKRLGKRRLQDKKLSEQRFDDLRNLSSDELLSKVSSIKNARWSPKGLEEHANRDLGHTFGKSIQDYEKKSFDVIRKPDSVYAYYDKQSNARRFAFYEKSSGAFVAASYDAMIIHSLHRRRMIPGYYLRIL